MNIENPVTGETFSDNNTRALAAAMREKGYTDGRWATYRQWQSIGRQVDRGQKSTKIVAPRGRDRKTGAPKFGRQPVFNFAQTVAAEQPAPAAETTTPAAPSAPTPAPAPVAEQPAPIVARPRAAAAKRSRRPRKKAPPRAGLLADITAQIRANAAEHEAAE